MMTFLVLFLFFSHFNNNLIEEPLNVPFQHTAPFQLSQWLEKAHFVMIRSEQ